MGKCIDSGVVENNIWSSFKGGELNSWFLLFGYTWMGMEGMSAGISVNRSQNVIAFYFKVKYWA